MTLRGFICRIIVLGLALLSFAAHAYHGMNEYDPSHTIELHGQVVGYKLLDPTPYSCSMLQLATVLSLGR